MMDHKWYPDKSLLLAVQLLVIVLAGVGAASPAQAQELPAQLIEVLEDQYGVSDADIWGYARGPGDVEVFIVESRSYAFSGAWAVDSNGARYLPGSFEADFPAEMFMRDPAVARALSRDWVRRMIIRMGGVEAANKANLEFGGGGFTTILGSAYLLEAGIRKHPDTTVISMESERHLGKISQWQEEVERVLATF